MGSTTAGRMTLRAGLIAALLAALLPVASAAQEIGESEETETPPGEVNETVVEDTGETVRKLGRPLQLPEDAFGSPFAIWPEGRLGYHFVRGGSPARTGMVALNLDTSAEVARRDSFADDATVGSAQPGPEQLIVDPDRGRVVFATPLTTNERLFQGQTAPQIVVLDAATLETRNVIDFAPITVEGRVVFTEVVAMHVVPPQADGGDKLLVVVEEVAGDVGNVQERDQNTNQVYAVQFDLASGNQEWTVLVETCRGGNKSSQNSHNEVTGSTPHRFMIFRTSRGQGASEAVYLTCHSTGAASPARVVRIPLGESGSPAFLPVEVGDPLPKITSGGDVGLDDIVRRAAQEVFPGPAWPGAVHGDPQAERVYVQVIDGAPRSEVWWVFDGTRSEWIGTVGIGKHWKAPESTNGIDPATGRLYVLAPTTEARDETEHSKAGGLFVADARRTPVAQAIRFPEFASLARVNVSPAEQKGDNNVPIVVDPGDDERPRRVYVRSGTPSVSALSDTAADFYNVLEDTVPVSEDLPSEDFEGRTDDAAEDPATTRVNYAGSARGYGFRTLLVGGAEAVFRLGPLDPTAVKSRGGFFSQQADRIASTNLDLETALGPTVAGADPCSPLNRDVSFAFVGPQQSAVLDGSGGRATAEPFVLDSTTRAQSEVPYSSCAPLDWTLLWTTLPFGSPPTAEPQIPWLFGDGAASCTAASDAEPERRSVHDPTLGAFTASVHCAGDVIRGSSAATTAGAEDVSVAHASSSFEIKRTDGLFARVESVARGISIGEIVRIDAVRAVAESWANGRAQPDDIAEDSNCDRTRTAGTCYTRVLQGIHTPTFSCEACYDQEAAVAAIQSALGDSWRVRLREPDEFLRRGTDNGYIAAIQKPSFEVFSDLTLNNDLIRFTVPALEVVRFADGETRGRQVFQFAGTEIATAYGIECFFEVVDGECRANPGQLTVALTDLDGAPLAGGVFEVYRDAEAAAPDPFEGLLDECEPVPTESSTEEATETESPTEEGSETEDPTEEASESESPTEDTSETESPTEGTSETESPSEEATETETSTDDPCEEPSDTESPTEVATASESPTEDATETASPADEGSASETSTEDTSPLETETEESPVEPVTSLLDPLADELVTVCTTAEDGVGDCSLELPPGNYIIHQAAAPTGFMAGPDFAVQLFEGGELTVTFTNISALGAVEIVLQDVDGTPLSDGRFEFYLDDGDGIVTPVSPSDAASGEQSEEPTPDATEEPTPGRTDPPAEVSDRLLQTCVTGADGRCSFTEIPLGPLGEQSFVVHQASAPAGFVPADDVPITLRGGQRYDLTFTNARNGARIEISLVDPAGTPLAGGAFTVYRDVNEDGVLDEGDVPYASCTTGADGLCVFGGLDVDPATVDGGLAMAVGGLALEVPLGAYIIHQTAAPEGYELAADVAFAFTEPGQVASGGIVNAAGGRVTPDLDLDGFSPPVVEGPFPYDPGVPAPQVAEGSIYPQQGLQLLQVPAQLFRLAVRNPMQAAAFGTLWLLFGAALGAVRRRLLLIELLGP